MSPERASATFDMPTHGEGGHRCVRCESRLCARVEEIPGVLRVECEANGPMRVDFDPERISEDTLDVQTRRFGAELEGVFAHTVWRIVGLDCPDCARNLEKAVTTIPGVVAADLNFARGTLLVEYQRASDPRAAVVRAVESSGHAAEQIGGPAEGAAPAGASWWIRNRTLVAVVGSGAGTAFALAVMLLAPGRLAFDSLAHGSGVMACVVAVAFGWVLLGPRAFSSLKARTVDINILMLIAVTGALALTDYVEAASVVFLYTLGGWLESRALARTRGSIRDLMELAPQLARVISADAATDTPLDTVPVGALVRIRPGERVPLDGIVAAGFSAVDEAAITGEPLPADKTVGERVFSGSLNTSGLLDVTVTAAARDSTLARVVQLVEQAQAAKAPVQQAVDRFSLIYTPSVVVLAIAVAAIPPVFGFGAPLVWITRALVLLVVACPCALVISTPVSLVSAISRAGRDGVLVKGGAYLEAAARVRAIAFDKTGTLTQGRPTLVDVQPFHDAISPAQLLALAASIEAHSNHPIARTIVRAARETGAAAGSGATGGAAASHVAASGGATDGGAEWAAARSDASHSVVSEFEELAGRGVQARIDGACVRVVSPAFAEEIGEVTRAQNERVAEAQAEGHTVLVVLREAEPLGLLGVADPLREEAEEVVRAVRAQGAEHTVLLTGDNEATAAAVAARAGLSAHMASLLPADKVDAVLRLKDRFGSVAMVGDGHNDAPALAVADIGIAMGAAGSDTALETADVALMADDLSALPGFFALGRRTLAIIWQNVTFSVVVKVAVLVAAILGYANMWLAVFADTGVALLVILNGMRLLGARRS
jgi:Zn2+/Cd2+-exporting ATPase